MGIIKIIGNLTSNSDLILYYPKREPDSIILQANSEAILPSSKYHASQLQYVF